MTIVSTFVKWAEGRDEIVPDVVQTLLDFKENYLGNPDPTRWECGDLEHLLLQVIPAKVTAPREWHDAVVPTTEAYVRFLAETGQLSRRGETLEHLLEELEDIDKDYAAAADDPALAGMAKSIFSSLLGDRVPEVDEFEELIERFNSLPDHERAAILDGRPATLSGPLAGVVYPAARKAPDEVLAAAAADSALIRRLLELADWAGTGRTITRTSQLPRPADLPELLSRLELDPGPHRLRSAKDHPALLTLWLLAEVLDWVTLEGVTAVTGETARSWAEGDAATRLHLWSDVFETLEFDEDEGIHHDLGDFDVEEAVAADVAAVLVSLFVDGECDVLPLIHAHGDDIDLTGTQAVAIAFGLQARLAHFVDAGAMLRDDDRYEVTDLGRYGIHRVLTSLGAEAPLIDPAQVTAVELLRTPQRLISESGLVHEWIAERGPEAAAHELASAAAELGTAFARVAMMSIVLDLEPSTTSSLVAAYRTHPALGVHVAVLADDGEAMSAPERIQLQLDGIGAVLLPLADDLRADDVSPELWSTAEPLLKNPDLWTHHHPDLLPILDAISSAHPLGRVRKLAKKHAYKRRQSL